MSENEIPDVVKGDTVEVLEVKAVYFTNEVGVQEDLVSGMADVIGLDECSMALKFRGSGHVVVARSEAIIGGLQVIHRYAEVQRSVFWRRPETR